MKKILVICLYVALANLSIAQEAKLSFGTDASDDPALIVLQVAGRGSDSKYQDELNDTVCTLSKRGAEALVGFDNEKFDSFYIKSLSNIKTLELEADNALKITISTGVNKLKLNCEEITIDDNLEFRSIESIADYVNIKTNSIKVGNMTYSYPGGFTLFRGSSNLMPYCFAQDRINQLSSMDKKQVAFNELSEAIENCTSLQASVANYLKYITLDAASVKNTLQLIASNHLGNNHTKLYEDYETKYINKLHVENGLVNEQDFSNALYDLQKVVVDLKRMRGTINHSIPDCAYELDITDLHYYATSGKTVKFGMQLVQSELDKYLSSPNVTKCFEFKTTASTKASVSTKLFIEHLNANRGGNLDFNTITGIMVNIKVEEMLPIIELCLSNGEQVDFREHPEMFLPRGDENNILALQQLKDHVNSSIKQLNEPIKFRRGYFTKK